MVAELNNLKYVLFVEFSLLVLFTVFGFVPFFMLMGLILLCLILYLTFNTPVIAVHVLIFSLLVDSFIPMKSNPTGHPSLVAEFFFTILLLFGSLKFLFNLDKKWNFPSFLLVWIPYLIWGLLIGLLIGIDKLKVLSYWKNYFAGFFAFSLAFYAIKSKFQLKSVIIGIIIWGMLLSLIEIKVLFELGGFAIGIAGLFLKKNLLTLGWGRSNYLAAFFVIIIPVAIGYLFYTKSRKLKIFIIAVLVLMSFATILTLSRGGILALLIALVILSSRVLKARTFIPLVVILLLITLVLLLNPLTLVLINRISSIDASGSYFSRVNFYKEVWQAFLKNPLTGVGIANLRFYATFILSPEDAPSAHNIVLGALGELGIIGAILYFATFGSLIRNVYSSFKIEKDESLKFFRWCCISSLLGGIIHSLVEPTFEGLQFSIIFWTLAGVYVKLNLLKTSDL